MARKTPPPCEVTWHDSLADQNHGGVDHVCGKDMETDHARHGPCMICGAYEGKRPY